MCACSIASVQIRKNGQRLRRTTLDIDRCDCASNGKRVQRQMIPTSRTTRVDQRPVKVGMISLGCAKNLVDAEIMLGSVLERGMRNHRATPMRRMCSSLTPAPLSIPRRKNRSKRFWKRTKQRGLTNRPEQKLIVSGCMSQRFASELREQLPEVDAFIGLDQVRELGAIVRTCARSA